MRLTQVTCRKFRCLQDISFEPETGINIIHGKNAQGKTSVLEAILFAATSKSHRTNNESELVGHGEEGFQITLHVQRESQEILLEAYWRQGSKRFKINGIAQSRVSDILGKIHVILFSPEDIDLIKGSAINRRKFLNMELSQLYPQYLYALQQYRQVLRQRNQVLRTSAHELSLLEVWDEQLVRHGKTLVAIRSNFVTELAGFATDAYNKIAQEEGLTIQYRPDVPEHQITQELWASTREIDARRKMTVRGPHRDDFDVLIEDRLARNFSSQGQQKTAALALKLAEMELIKTHIGEYPILMLDEVLSELDALRAKRLFDALAPGIQCLLTTTQLDRAPVSARRNFVIERGRLEKQ